MAEVIRGADPADYDRVVAQLDRWWGGRHMAPMLPRLFFQHFGPWTFIAENDGNVVGFLAGFRSQTDERQVYCHFIGVAPAARGLGIGEALYHRLFTDAQAAGCTEILAVTSPVNIGSIAFHGRMGFEPFEGPQATGDVPCFANYNGPGEDRVRFRKWLTNPTVEVLVTE